MADNMDDILNNDEKYEPTAKELLEMLDSADLDEETRQSLRSLLGGDVPQFFGGTGSGTLLAITFAALIFSIICETWTCGKMDEQYLKEQLNIGKLIKEKVADSLRNVDVLNVLKKMVDSAPESEETEEIRQQLDAILTQYNSLPDEQKTQFAYQVKEALTNKLAKKLEEAPLDFSEVETFLRDAVRTQIYLYAAAAVILAIIIVFFGYKLYKSIKEKEKKKEEKKKLKQMKKKK